MIIRNSLLIAGLALSTLMFSGCGSSSSNQTEFSGTLQETDISGRSLRVENGLGQVTICALGSCDTTDNEGNWAFKADAGSFDNEVLFTFNGEQDVVVSGLDNESEEIFIAFGVGGNGNIDILAVSQNDFDDDLDDEIVEETEDIADEIDDEADDIADDIDDEADDIVDDIDEEIDEI